MIMLMIFGAATFCGKIRSKIMSKSKSVGGADSCIPIRLHA